MSTLMTVHVVIIQLNHGRVHSQLTLELTIEHNYNPLITELRPVATEGVGGVATPPSGINDIHNTNYLIQDRPFDCF